MDINKLEKILQENGEPSFRLAQIKKAIFQDGVSDFSDITTIPKDLRETLRKSLGSEASKSGILSFKVDKILISKDKRSIKALLRLSDGNFIETVLISPKPGGWSVCVSSQVGCPLGCKFCATGSGGFKRDLTAEEITDQILFWRQYINGQKTVNNEQKNKIDTIVFMGMGEPFLNWENVRNSLKDLINPELFGFGSRSISISTSGIPEGVEKLSEEFPQVNLAISLHFASDEERNKYMPINKKYNLADLCVALQEYFSKCSRKVFVEYILLENINDSQSDTDNLIKYLKSIGKIHLLHVNLIQYNSASDDILRSSPAGVAREFKEYLLRNGISVTIRKSLGSDIAGACGQLTNKK